jgi:hypothetical protein
MGANGNLQFVGNSALLIKDFEVRGGTKGDTTHFRVTSPILAGGSSIFSSLQNYYNYLRANGADVSFRGVDGGMDRELVVEIPGLTSTSQGILSEDYFDQWELLTNEGSDTIFANPLIIGSVAADGRTAPILNYNDKVVLSRLARDGGNIIDAVSSCNSDLVYGALIAPTLANGGKNNNGSVQGAAEIPASPGPPATPDVPAGPIPPIIFQSPSSNPANPTQATPVQQLALETLKGQTENYTPSRVLRHTSYCSPNATYNSNIAGEDLIYTTSQLLSEVGSGWTYNLPPRLYSKISSFLVQYAAPEEANYYTWGWLKKITREPVLANFMVEVNVEYELALWSNLRYGLK